MLKPQQQIDQLLAQINGLRAQIDRCPHKWEPAYQDVAVKKVPRQENRPMGSDFFNPVTVGWDEVRTPVWRRKCGKIETTTETKAVVTVHKPVF